MNTYNLKCKLFVEKKCMYNSLIIWCPPIKAIILQTTEPATPTLYVVKSPVETVSVWEKWKKLKWTY
jgi:hypothetical protein